MHERATLVSCLRRRVHDALMNENLLFATGHASDLPPIFVTAEQVVAGLLLKNPIRTPADSVHVIRMSEKCICEAHVLAQVNF